jgi:RNA-directed DNA polymerase
MEITSRQMMPSARRTPYSILAFFFLPHKPDGLFSIKEIVMACKTEYPSYDDVFTFANLYKAYLKARRSKRHKKDVILFEMGLGAHLWELKHQLDSRTYKVSGYNHFVIFEPKRRDIQSLRYYDRIVQHCLVDNYLMPLLENNLIYDNGACRKEKGTDFCRGRVTKFLTEHYRRHGTEGYVLQFDIHHYFESIDHERLKEILERKITDAEIKSLLFSIIDSYHREEGKGLPMGNQTSQCFALLYLDSVDRLIKERYCIKYYSRYMDDGIAISNDKRELQKLLADINAECQRLGIALNSKTRIFKLSEGFTYLGCRYRILDGGRILRTLPSSKRKRMRRHIKNIRPSSISSLASYKGYLRRLSEHKLTAKIAATLKKNKTSQTAVNSKETSS